jgi:hypothetical protein
MWASGTRRATLFSRNVEAQGIWIQRWMTGLVTQRSPLFTPISAMGLQFISRMDALIDGLNMEISPIMTLTRRPAYPRFCSTAFGAGDYPLNFYSFQNTSGAIYPLADTPNKVYNFTATSNLSVLSKSAGAGRGDFLRVGDYVYYCNGVDLLFWDGTTWRKWGIVGPAAAPTFTMTAGTLNPQTSYQYVVAYVNTVTGHVSAASPISANTGCQINQNFIISYIASTDPQVNAIWIFRTADGGGLFYFLASVPNATSTYTDSTPDTGLNSDPGFVATFSPNNAPCPTGSSLVCWFDGRPWVASKNFVYWALGPQATIGVGEQAFNLSTNFFKLPIQVIGFAPTSQGLLIFTQDMIWAVTGTGGVYFINPYQSNLGIANPNAVTQDGDLVFFVTTRGQCFTISSGGLAEIGQPIRAQIAAMNPLNVSCTIHRSGQDEGFFVSDGVSKIYRYSMTFGCWCPAGIPVQGAGVIKSIETSTALWTLTLGSTIGAKYIGGRSLTNWTDDGGTYSCFSTVGSLIIGPPTSKNNIESVSLSATRVGNYPSIYVMPNEISSAQGIGFCNLPNPVPEPPNIPPGSQSLWTMRHYLKSGSSAQGNPIPQEIQHMQVKISFQAENYPSEVLALGVN